MAALRTGAQEGQRELSVVEIYRLRSNAVSGIKKPVKTFRAVPVQAIGIRSLGWLKMTLGSEGKNR